MRINIEFAVLDNAVGVELTEFREHQGVGVLNDSVFLAGGGDGKMCIRDRFYITPYNSGEEFYPQFYRRITEASEFAARSGIKASL